MALNLFVSPSAAKTGAAGQVTFTASGGTGSGYSWTIAVNNSGSSIVAGTGAYTAGPLLGVADTVQVTDSGSNTAQAIVQVISGPTLLSIRTQARQRADMVNSQFVTDAEFNSYINASYFELYDVLVQKFGDNYNVAPFYKIQTDGQSDQYPLPPDFYKLLGCDLLLGNTPAYSLTIKPFQMAERNRWAWPNMQALYGLVNLRYRVHGNSIWFVPRAAAGQTIRLIYVPRMTTLVSDTDIVDGVSGWEEYIVVDAALKAVVKEESDPSPLMAMKQGLTSRIEAAAENRDAGAPATVSDSRGSDYEWPPGASGWGWGGGL